MRSAAAISLGIVLACAALSTSAGPARAVDPTIDPNTACATGFVAIRVAGDPDAVIVRASDLAGPFQGTITALAAPRSGAEASNDGTTPSGIGCTTLR